MIDRLREKPRFALLLLVLIAIMGILALVITTRWGIGASPDSVVYLGGARSISSGQGYRYPSWDGLGEPVTHFPPFYPLILAIGDLIGIDPLHGARLLNLFLFAANILLFGFILIKNESESGWLFTLGTFIVLTSTPMLTIHSMAWSEPLFLLQGFVSLLVLAAYLQTQRILLLLTSALLAGLAILTRYAGVVFVVAGFFGLLLMGTSSFGKRAVNGLVYGVLGIIPGCVWVLRNQWIAGTATNREIIYHPISVAKLMGGVRTMAKWIMIPGSLSSKLLAGIVLLVGLCCLVTFYLSISSVKDWNSLSLGELWQRIPVFFRLLGIFIPVYFGFLIASISFVDANTPLDDRILSPIFWGGSLLILSYLSRLTTLGNRILSRIILVGVILFLVASAIRARSFVLDGYQYGLGMNGLIWQQSETIVQVKAIPLETPIYSNAAEAVYLHTNHAALRIPLKIERVTGQLNPEYESILQDMQRAFSQHNGVLVYFDFFQPPGYPSAMELVELFSLKILAQAADGTIYSAGIVP